MAAPHLQGDTVILQRLRLAVNLFWLNFFKLAKAIEQQM